MSVDYLQLLPEGFVPDPERGPVYSQAPDDVDDLTAVHGIGEVLEAQLNLNGVYRLEQIAAWDQINIEAFSRLMPCFQDRIERNYWILQAQRLVEKRRRSARSAAGTDAFPAGILRTVLVLSIALFLGLLAVQWLDGGEPETYAGSLKARTFVVTAPQDGQLSDLLVSEGDQVLEGQDVALLQNRISEATRSEHVARVASTKQAVEQAQAQAALDLKWKRLDIDERILKHQRALAELSSPSADSAADESETKSVSEAVASAGRTPLIFFPASGARAPVPVRTASRSTPEFPAAPVAMEPDPEQTKLIQQRIAELKKLRESLADQIQAAGGVVAAEQAHRLAVERLNSIHETAEETTMTTSGYGIVSRCLCEAGDSIRTGDAMIELVDTRRRYVTVLIPSHRNSVKPGMKVSLYFPGQQHRRGRITALPVRTTQRGPRGEAMVEVRVEPMGGLWPNVPIGSQVRVAIDK